MTPPTFSIKSDPFITRESLFSGLIIPHSIAMALAVIKLSPVTILTLTPAALHLAIAPGTSYLKISLIPTRATIFNPDFSTLNTPLSSFSSRSSDKETSF